MNIFIGFWLSEDASYSPALIFHQIKNWNDLMDKITMTLKGLEFVNPFVLAFPGGGVAHAAPSRLLTNIRLIVVKWGMLYLIETEG